MPKPAAGTRFIVVTGGVLSGLGKGITTASLGKILQWQGHRVTAIKIDPYLNRDAGTMRPTEHGEVWVTADGGEIDQDLGNYERFLGIELNKNHNITSGKVYWRVLRKEREGGYLGKTVQPIPHVIDEINSMILEVAAADNADFLLIEVGGQVGDYENILFLEALRQLKFEHPVMFVHVGYLPVPEHLGEMKTKPLQHSIHALRALGIIPDIVVGRSSRYVDEHRKRKIALTCGIAMNMVFSNPDVKNIYEVPLILKRQGIDRAVMKHFGMKPVAGGMERWAAFIDTVKKLDRHVNVGIVGKYFDSGDFSLHDSYISVIECVKHAAWKNRRNPEIAWLDAKDLEGGGAGVLDGMDCVVVPGGFGVSGIEGKILAAQHCRERGIPYLGLCLGMQVAVVEFARNVCGLQGANSTEFDPTTGHPVICILPGQAEKMKRSQYGASMRLGGQDVSIVKGTRAEQLYKTDVVRERFRHRYEVNPDFIATLQEKGLVFSGTTPDKSIMQIAELPNHCFFMGSQFHPEFTSRPMAPHPLFDGLLQAAVQRADARTVGKKL